MTERKVRHVMVAALLAACSAAMGAGQAGAPLPEAADLLLRTYPGSRLAWEGDRVRAFYGVPMTPGRTPAEAAALWLDQHAQAFGAGALELDEAWSSTVQNERFTVFAYRQRIDGLPVEYGTARLLVLNGPVNRVVYAAGRLAPRPADGFPAVQVDGETALAIAQADEAYAHLPVWSAPELVVWQGEERWQEPVRTWKFVGEVPELARRERLTFFVDAATGELVHVRNEVLHADVIGTIQGNGTPGDRPDTAANPPVLLDMPEIRIQVTGGNNAYSDRSGNFTIPHAGTTNVTVTTNVSSGRWVNVNPQGVAELTLSQSVTPGVPASLVMNTSPNQAATAQINAFIHTINVHNFFRDRSGSWSNIDTVMTANTGVSGTCNAFYDGSSINFYNAGGGCVNTAYSTVVHHEYGHHIVNRLFLSQGAFGEGFGDVMGILIMDTGIVGRDFCGTGCHVRNVDTANQQYPCGSAIHTCGQVLGGVWRDIRLEFGSTYGSAPGLDMARDLAVAWALITVGGSGSDSAHPTTAIEVLTVDDDDGNINNGSPNYTDICQAFDKHNIDCPALQLIAFEYPDGRPAFITPSQPAEIRVNVVPLAGQPQAGTGRVAFRTGSGSFTVQDMTQTAPNQYIATLPAAACGSIYEYYFSAQATSGMTITDPANAPASTFTTLSGVGTIVAVDDAMEANTGWTVGAPGDAATTGIWNRMDPQPTPAQPGDDHTPAPGVMCWVTDGNAGASIGDRDIDGGATTLVSPVYDLSASGDAVISYWRWYSNNQGSAPNADTFVIEVSNNGGSSWTNVETVGPAGPEAGGGWYYHEFRLGSRLATSANVRLRFIASDLGSGSIVEAAVDDLRIVVADCGSCPADFDGDGELTVADFTAFRSAFLAGDPAADFDSDGDLTVADFTSFRNAFLAGCP